jgi:D-amino-acid dehydrogenase
MRWLWSFHRHCTHRHVERSMELLGPLGHLGRRLFDELLEEEALDCHFKPDGYYEVYQTSEGLSAAEHEIPLQRAHGYDTRALGGEALRELEPALRPGTVGGVYFPEAATLDPGRFMDELASAARTRGVELRPGARVVQVIAGRGRARGVLLEGGETILADAVVLATGAYSLALARVAGLRLPIQPAKGYHRDLGGEAEETPPLRITAMLGERYVFCTPMGEFLRLAGTLELSGLNHEIVKPRLDNLQESAARYIVGMEGRSLENDWVGLRPVTPDGLPVLGPARGLDGLFVANGHAMLGVTLGPVSGKILAEWIVGGAPPRVALSSDAPALDLAALRPDRF